MAIKIYSRFDRPEGKAVDFSGDDGISRTEQHFKKECDINEIIRNFVRTGINSHPANGKPQFGDFTAFPDFREAQEMLVDATRKFEALPSRLRDRFGNDPRNLVSFVMDESNRDEAVKLGLAVRKEGAGEKVPVSPDLIVPPPPESIPLNK